MAIPIMWSTRNNLPMDEKLPQLVTLSCRDLQKMIRSDRLECSEKLESKSDLLNKQTQFRWIKDQLQILAIKKTNNEHLKGEPWSGVHSCSISREFEFARHQRLRTIDALAKSLSWFFLYLKVCHHPVGKSLIYLIYWTFVSHLSQPL